MKRYFIIFLFFILLFVETGYSQNNLVTVYTTAENTNYRISKTDSSFQFSDFGQPAETQVFVFVDASHSFQTVIGIGGAITDASAETFAKLPLKVQKSFLTSYYDTVK